MPSAEDALGRSGEGRGTGHDAGPSEDLGADVSRPTAVVDLDALGRNVARLRRHAGPHADLLVAVKADAYGHGLVPIARALAREEVGWLGVATPDEALTLRRAGFAGRILLFGPIRGPSLVQLIAADVDLTVTSEADVEAAAHARLRVVDARSGEGEARGPGGATPSAREAAAPPVVRMHLKVDTGMGRLGSPPPRTVRIARTIGRHEGCEFTAAWTHFARADEPAANTTGRQLARFHEALDALDAADLRPRLRHAANSAALLTVPEARFDLVRPGLAAYGHHGSEAVARAAPDLEPILTLSAPVVFAKRVSAGDAISYSHRWTAPRDTNVATVRIGYGDGYPRAFSNLGEARFPNGTGRVAGIVCMDQTMFDLGDGSVQVGDRAVLLGPGGPDAREAAESIGTIAYELLTRLTPRVPKRYRFTGSDADPG